VETELEPLGCSGCSGICLLRNTVDDSSWGAAGSFLVLKGSSALTVRPIHWAYTLIAMSRENLRGRTWGPWFLELHHDICASLD
jgi:hypothetical protein